MDRYGQAAQFLGHHLLYVGVARAVLLRARQGGPAGSYVRGVRYGQVLIIGTPNFRNPEKQWHQDEDDHYSKLDGGLAACALGKFLAQLVVPD